MTEQPKKTLSMKMIPVTEMDCPTCAPILEKEIKKLRGVADAQANYITKMMKVTYDPDLVRVIDIETAIERVGYLVAYKNYPSAATKIKNFFKRQKTDAVKVLMDSDFYSKVIHNTKPVAVLFYSPTCRPCQMAKKSFLQAAEVEGEKANFFEMDVASTETWRTYEITATPTTVIFIDGKPKSTFTSIPEKEEIVNALEKRIYRESDGAKN